MRRHAALLRSVRERSYAGVELLSVLAHREPALLYAGPARSSNAGDRLLHDAHRSLLAPVRLPPLQTSRAAKWYGSIRRPTPVARPRVLLGGGTLVGDPRWRTILAQAQPSSGQPLVALGVGVLDPRSPQFQDVQAELLRWVPLLRRIGTVPVRGPLSAEVLADLGLDVRVTGDPVLAWASPPPHPPRSGVLGINVGATRASRTFGTTSGLVEALVDLARRWQDHGGRVTLFSVWPPDEAVCLRIAGQLARTTDVVAWRGDARHFLDRLQQCEVIVAQKLHAAVLGVVAERPVVIVEYQAKCRDFAESVGMGELCLRMDEVDGQGLLEAAVHAAQDRGRLVDVQRRRRALVDNLEAQARIVRSTVAPG